MQHNSGTPRSNWSTALGPCTLLRFLRYSPESQSCNSFHTRSRLGNEWTLDCGTAWGAGPVRSRALRRGLLGKRYCGCKSHERSCQNSPYHLVDPPVVCQIPVTASIGIYTVSPLQTFNAQRNHHPCMHKGGANATSLGYFSYGFTVTVTVGVCESELLGVWLASPA
jgi:hypothetical protein